MSVEVMLDLDSAYALPLFAPMRPWLVRLPDAPSSDALKALAADHPVYLPTGKPIRFAANRIPDMPYECRIWETGEVETREDNWHDFFNALIWLTFPQTKLAISQRHVAAMQAPGEKRNLERDALTHFDECGIVVLSSEPYLLELLRGFEWKALFVDQREAVKRAMQFIVFGHATYEQLLNPFRGVTAKAILYDTEAGFAGLGLAEQLATVDQRLAADFRAGLYQRPRELQPLPLLGIPGMTPENESPAYYDDAWQFRPGRKTG